VEELRDLELLHQALRFFLCVLRIDGQLINNIAVRIRYGLCHSICFAVPSTSLFSEKKETNDRGKILWQAQSGYELPFSTICAKIEWARRWGVTACATIEALPHLTSATATFHETWDTTFWKPPVSFLPLPYRPPSFIFCEITFYPAHFFSHPMLAEISFSSFSKILSS